MTNEVSTLGGRLREAREAAGLSVATLAQKASLAEDALRRFEAGAIAALTTGNLGRLADLLLVPRMSLLNPDAPFSVAASPNTLLKTGDVRSRGHLADADTAELARALGRARLFAELRASLGRPSLLSSFSLVAAPEHDAHEPGYADADIVREKLVGRVGLLSGLRRIVEDRFGILVVDIAFADKDVVGAACRLGDARVIAVQRGLPTETWRRFVIGHELEHHLRDLGPSAGEVSTFSVDARFNMEPSAMEKRANAFSAMLLAPAPAVREELGEPKSRTNLPFAEAREWVERVSQAFGIGFAATAWHLRNLRYYDWNTAKELVSIADGGSSSGFEEDTPYDGLAREVFVALSREEISLGRARDLIGPLVEEWEQHGTGAEQES
jgi:Zn-dependent peptidase ImmA (M78 family)/transcriptional regulator with XRE-family HTH domain